ncbi:hypothetical protein DVH24_041583, partial [Malus domestica]
VSHGNHRLLETISKKWRDLSPDYANYEALEKWCGNWLFVIDELIANKYALIFDTVYMSKTHVVITTFILAEGKVFCFSFLAISSWVVQTIHYRGSLHHRTGTFASRIALWGFKSSSSGSSNSGDSGLNIAIEPDGRGPACGSQRDRPSPRERLGNSCQPESPSGCDVRATSPPFIRRTVWILCISGKLQKTKKKMKIWKKQWESSTTSESDPVHQWEHRWMDEFWTIGPGSVKLGCWCISFVVDLRVIIEKKKEICREKAIQCRGGDAKAIVKIITVY